MRVAITANGKDLDAEMDPRFGRAPFILIVDTEGTIVDVIDNEPNRAAMGGAGIGAAKMLSDRGVDVLLTGRCGPNARTALDAAGIQICEVQAQTPRRALEQFNRGELASLSDDDRDVTYSPRGNVGAPVLGRGRGLGMGRGMGRAMGRGMGRGRGTW
jgi:predicted Fe-Mo cluster-binding NifX family protein